MTENHLTMSESVPRDPRKTPAGPSGTDTLCIFWCLEYYTEGIKAQSG